MKRILMVFMAVLLILLLPGLALADHCGYVAPVRFSSYYRPAALYSGYAVAPTAYAYAPAAYVVPQIPVVTGVATTNAYAPLQLVAPSQANYAAQVQVQAPPPVAAQQPAPQPVVYAQQPVIYAQQPVVYTPPVFLASAGYTTPLLFANGGYNQRFFFSSGHHDVQRFRFENGHRRGNQAVIVNLGRRR